MGNGARINKKYLNPHRRKSNFKKCVVCGKALHPSNKSGICSGDKKVELDINYRKQGFTSEWKKENKSRLKEKN